jgi:hypothetical protein
VLSVLAPSVTAAERPSRYSLAGGCYSLGRASSGDPVPAATRTGSSRIDPTEAVPVRAQKDGGAQFPFVCGL